MNYRIRFICCLCRDSNKDLVASLAHGLLCMMKLLWKLSLKLQQLNLWITALLEVMCCRREFSSICNGTGWRCCDSCWTMLAKNLDRDLFHRFISTDMHWGAHLSSSTGKLEVVFIPLEDLWWGGRGYSLCRTEFQLEIMSVHSLSTNVFAFCIFSVV